MRTTIIKLARNALENFGAFNADNNLVEWKYIIDKLFKLQTEIGFKIGNEINLAHINWKENAMKVKLAVQTLSNSVADALVYFPKHQMNLRSVQQSYNLSELWMKYLIFLSHKIHFQRDSINQFIFTIFNT